MILRRSGGNRCWMKFYLPEILSQVILNQVANIGQFSEIFCNCHHWCEESTAWEKIVFADSVELYLFLWICVFVFVSSGQISATAVANMKKTQHGGTLDCICAGLKYVISSVDSMELQVKSHSNAQDRNRRGVGMRVSGDPFAALGLRSTGAGVTMWINW